MIFFYVLNSHVRKKRSNYLVVRQEITFGPKTLHFWRSAIPGPHLPIFPFRYRILKVVSN